MEFRILGSLDAFAEGERVPLGGRKQRAVLGALLLRANEAVPRGQLVDAVWGEAPPKTAVATLQVYVHALRRVLGAERIETVGESYRLVVGPDEFDLSRFERLVRGAREALAQGRPGDALEDAEAALALWTGTGPVELAERRLEALELRNDARLELGDHEAVLRDVAQSIAEEPYRERLRSQQILALYRAGRQAEALDAYRAARTAWIGELGIEPTPALRDLERAVLQQDPALAPPPALPTLETRLPVPPTPLVGRGLELAAVSALLRTDARLVTLLGPGGAGKTRLAIAVAEELAPELRDGAVFVDLSQVTDPELLLPAIDEAAGHDLSARSLLLVLDNLEQLVPNVLPVAALLASAPRLRVLVTSRAPLRLSGEHEYPIPPLPENEAVQLFAARARAADPSFTVDDNVLEICRRLDGLPLALELAAARVKLLPLPELLGGLELAAGPRDAPARHQTLTATIAWSYDLLSTEERDAFARLSVFAGSFAAEAAERVCGVPLDLVGALVDHSLLQRRPGPRFAMLETIRRFALERLEPEVRRAHARWVADLAERAEQELATGTDQATWLDALDAEHDNIRAALSWSLDDGDIETALRIASSLRIFWDVRGHLVEGLRWLEQVLSRADGAPADALAKANGVGGALAFHRGEYDRARSFYERMQVAFEEAGNPIGIARALSDLGTVAAAVGDYDVALELLGRSADAYRELGERRPLAIVLGNLGHIASEREDFAAAIGYASEALAIQQAEGDSMNACVSRYNLGDSSLLLGDLEQAEAYLRDALSAALEIGYREVLAYTLSAWVRLSILRDDDEVAAELVGTVDTVLEESGVTLLASAETLLREAAATARERLGDDRYATAYARGRARSASEALSSAGTRS